jgi:hypothetical protein
MLDRVEGLLVLFIEHVLAHGGIEGFELPLLDLLPAFFLKPAQFNRVFLFPAMQARFLELQIAELFLIGEMRLELDHGGAERQIVIVERFGELNAALCVDGHLETRDTSEVPGRVGDGLDDGLPGSSRLDGRTEADGKRPPSTIGLFAARTPAREARGARSVSAVSNSGVLEAMA